MLKSSSFILKPVTNSYELPHYLAGLIEGEGSVIVPAKGITSYSPYFEIVFHIEDKVLAEYVQLIIGGKFIIKENYCVLIIKSKDSVQKVISLINGKMRTPKVEALHRMIIWLNLKYGYKKPLLDLDNSPINSNSWLSGFIDADGSFILIGYAIKKVSLLACNTICEYHSGKFIIRIISLIIPLCLKSLHFYQYLYEVDNVKKLIN